MKIVLYPLSVVSIVLLFAANVVPEGNPGKASCYYFADVAMMCNGTPVAVSDLPPECESFIYDGLQVDAKDITNENYKFPELPYLTAIEKTDKPAYLCIKHKESVNWRYDQEGMDGLAKNDSDFIKLFMGKHKKLSGLVFLDVDISLYKDDYPKFTKNIQVYLAFMRKTVTPFTIGVSISSKFVVDLLETNNTNLDFAVFDMEVDFYMFTFDIFNPCVPDLIKGGTIPMDGPYKYTLVKLHKAIQLLNIKDKNKIYYRFQLFAISNRSRKLTYKNECFSSYERMCKYPNETKCWCAETSKTLRLKGAFSRDTGGGLIVDSIDLNDPHKSCNCSSPFPSFYYLLDGFNNKTTQADCPLFDRTGI